MQLRRYTVDLQAYMAECEANYRRLMKLLPVNNDEVVYQVQLPGQSSVLMRMRVLERCKYTTMMTIEQACLGDWLPDYHFEVRIYHDAKMAEVISFQKQGRMRPVYGYPNEKMHQKDEKFQQHYFLSECLANCLKNGFSETQIPVV